MPATESSAAALLDQYDLYKDYIGQIQAQKQDTHVSNDEINNREII